jgi:nucleoid-associated protein YejK
MKYLSLTLCLFLAVCCASCASKEQVYEHIYGNLKMRERMEMDPLDLASQDQVSYARYKKEKDASFGKEPPPPVERAQY